MHVRNDERFSRLHHHPVEPLVPRDGQPQEALANPRRRPQHQELRVVAVDEGQRARGEPRFVAEDPHDVLEEVGEAEHRAELRGQAGEKREGLVGRGPEGRPVGRPVGRSSRDHGQLGLLPLRLPMRLCSVRHGGPLSAKASGDTGNRRCPKSGRDGQPPPRRGKSGAGQRPGSLGRLTFRSTAVDACRGTPRRLPGNRRCCSTGRSGRGRDSPGATGRRPAARPLC